MTSSGPDRLVDTHAGRLAWDAVCAGHPLPMWVFDPESLRVLTVNDAAVARYGYTREEFVGLTILDLRPADEIPALLAQLERDATGRAATSGPWRHRTKAGDILHVRAAGTGIEWDGRTARLVTLIDVSEQIRAERDRERSAQALRRIVEHSPNLFYSHTPDHVLTYLSPQAEHFFDCSAEEALRRWTEFATDHPANQIGLERTERAIETGEPQPPYELELRTVKGRRLWVQVNEGPVVVDGKTVAIVGTLTDVTERKRAEERLRLSDAILSRLANLVLVADASGAITYASPSVQRILGYQPEELLGEGWWELAYPDPVERAEARRGTVRSALGADTLPPPYERPVRRRDRTTRWIRWHESQGPGGTVVGVGADVTAERTAEHALRESEERFRTVMEQAGDGLFLHDAEGRLRMVNEAACRLLGYTRDELLRLTVTDFVLEARPDRLVGPRLAALPPGQSLMAENRLRRRDGTTVPVEVRAGWLDVGGDPLILAIARDVTERREAEAALRESERRYRDLVANAPLGVYRTTQDGRMLFVNPALARMVGWEDPADLIGKRLEEAGLAATYDRTWFRELLERDGEIHGLEASWTRRDGSRFFGREHARVVRDPETGAVLHYDGTIEDISERVEAEAARRATEESYRALIERATYGIARATAEGRVVSANPAFVRMLGYEAEEQVRDLSLPDDICVDPQDAQCKLGRFLEQDTVDDMEVRWRRRDGTELLVRVSGRAMRDAEGRPVSLELIVDDITERRALEAQLRQAQKMEAVGQLTGGIAHDFNNILTVILAHADLLSTRLEHDAEMRSDVSELQQAARRGAEMIRKLLAFSRNEQLTVKPLDPRRLVHETGGMLRRLLPETIRIRVDAGPNVPAIRADRAAVEQMLLNLATNARDAMGAEGGTLSVTVARHTLTSAQQRAQGWGETGEYVCVAVRDTGCGMDERTVARIFEPFFTTKPVGTGTGLGMAMIYGLMKQHDGYVDIESRVGAGTTVRLLFPPVAPEPDEQAAEPGGGLAGLRTGSERILLVEDEERLRRAAARILRSLGYEVSTAVDGQEALEMLSGGDTAIDLIISDVVMPRVGGRALQDALRERGLTTRVLFTSGYAPRDARIEAADGSAAPFLRKPWTLAELAHAVRDILDGDG